MIKLKKKITRLKTHHFLKEKKLVLFFHCNYKKKGNKNLDMIQPLLSSKQGLSYFLKGSMTKNVLLIRNKIAQALMLQLATGSSLPEKYKGLSADASINARFDKISTPLDAHEKESVVVNSFNRSKIQHYKKSYEIDETPFKHEINTGVGAAINAQRKSRPQQALLSYFKGVEEATLSVALQESHVTLLPSSVSTRSCLQTTQNDAVLYGPNVFLGISEMSQLGSVLKEYKKQDALILFGGFYGNRVVNHLQIEKLGLLSQKESDSSLYLELMDSIKRPALQALSTIRSCTPIFCLKEVQHRLIKVFNLRIGQLSTKSNSA